MFAAIDHLYSTFAAAVTLGAATPPVAVYDGPRAAEPGQNLLSLYIGVDDPGIVGANTGPVAAAGAWTWAGLGRLARYETFEVPCCALAADAASDMRSARLAAKGIYDAVDALLVPGDVDLGGTVLFISGVSTYALRQDQFTTGAVAWLTFAVGCKTRI
jgi:hypothetical protein